MSCFTRPVTQVVRTRLFARAVDDRQVLAYAAAVKTPHDVAMVIPLPTPPGTSSSAVRFIDLSSYATFFGDLRRAFPPSAARPPSRSFSPNLATLLAAGPLEGTFLPSFGDFDRFEPWHRLSATVVTHHRHYTDWGFALFKLRGETVVQEIRPFAIEFPRRDPSQLYFPTYDGSIKPEASFDHILYWQPQRGRPEGAIGAHELRRMVDIDRTRGAVDPALPLATRAIHGAQANADTFIDD